MAKRLRSESASAGFEELELRVGYIFRNRALLEQALTHKSYRNEHRETVAADNERLEFLGDAVLGLIVGHRLMERFPQLSEGELSMMRAQIVNEKGLAKVAGEIALGEWLYLGRGEVQTGGRQKRSILADACEALIGAVYLDGGFLAAFETVKSMFQCHFDDLSDPGCADYKTRFQEAAQARLHKTPRYNVTDQSGPDHRKFFEVAVLLEGREYGRAGGKSKKEAEQRAAKQALEALEAEMAEMADEAGEAGEVMNDNAGDVES